jgi:hypothetical protein
MHTTLFQFIIVYNIQKKTKEEEEEEAAASGALSYSRDETPKIQLLIPMIASPPCLNAA